MVRENGTDGADDTRGPLAVDASPVDHALTEDEVTSDVRTLATLGNDTRYEALRLVERRKDGRWRYYTATPRAGRLLRFLDETRTATRTDG
ncbi:MAG: hypothetical protein V5A62_11275 [Haloarculaceae archaeon]